MRTLQTGQLEPDLKSQHLCYVRYTKKNNLRYFAAKSVVLLQLYLPVLLQTILLWFTHFLCG